MQLNRNDIAPKYLQIYEYLHGIIRRNRIAFGDKLPTEMELAEKFNVTRMTVRKAFDRLVVEEMVVRKRGQGTFLVSKTPKEFIYGLDITTGFFKDIRNYGLQPSSKTLKVEVVNADQKIIRLLELAGNLKVISMLRIFYADDEPMMIEKNYMSHDEFKDLLKVDLSGLRYPVLKEKYNIVPHHANQSFKAVLCDQESMSLFGFSDHQACVELEFAVYDASNVPIEVGYYLYRGDRYKFNINSIEYLID
jgi:DNA-binding GntR family transcriptional regulator